MYPHENCVHPGASRGRWPCFVHYGGFPTNCLQFVSKQMDSAVCPESRGSNVSNFDSSRPNPEGFTVNRLRPRLAGQAARTKAMARFGRIGRAVGPDCAGLDIRRCARKSASVGADRRGSLQASPAVSGKTGRRDWTRTNDPHHVKVVL